MKKLGKKNLIIVGITASLVVAAAIAIPVGIVYGKTTDDAKEEMAETLPVAFTLPDAQFTYGNIPATNPKAPPPPSEEYAGYVGTFLSAKVKTQSEIKDENSPQEGASVIFKEKATRTINSNTVIEVTFRYEPPPGSTGNLVLAKQNYTVMPIYVQYSGKDSYPDQNVPYGTLPSSSLFSLPSSLPDTAPGNNSDKFVIDLNPQKTVAVYYVSKTVDNGPKEGTVSIESIATWPPGVEIEADYGFTAKDNYAVDVGRKGFFVNKKFIIVKAKANPPANTETTASFPSGFAPAKPSAPQKVAGYAGAFTKAVKNDSSGDPTKDTDLSEWKLDGTEDSKNLNKLPAGAKITVTYTYTLDDKNYEGTASVASTQVFTVTS